MLLSNQCMFLDPRISFLSPACLKHSCYVLSAAPLSSVPFWAYSQLQPRSAGIFLLHYNVIGRATQQVTDKSPMCVWQNQKAEKHQQPPKENTWSVIIRMGLRTRWGDCSYLKTTLQPYPVHCTQLSFLWLKDAIELENALEDTKKA